MRIYNFNEYRDFLRKHILSLPKKGRGEISKMAVALRIPQPLMSQILSGDKDLNLEQADLLSDHLHLTENEKSYLFTLVQIEKAGRQNLKKFFISQREKIRKEASDIQNVVTPNRKLTEVEKATFYSSWLYQATRLLTSIENKKYSNLEMIAEDLHCDRRRVSQTMSFLLETGLVIQEKGIYKIGASSTHLENTSAHLPRHHSNWRMQALQKSEQLSEEELMFTAPMTLSQKDFALLREKILILIKEVYATVGDSPAEQLACLNIDFFKIR